jgi:hypothetical protein
MYVQKEGLTFSYFNFLRTIQNNFWLGKISGRSFLSGRESVIFVEVNEKVERFHASQNIEFQNLHISTRRRD